MPADVAQDLHVTKLLLVREELHLVIFQAQAVLAMVNEVLGELVLPSRAAEPRSK